MCESRRGESGAYCVVVNGSSVFDGAELQASLCPETYIFVVNCYLLNKDSMRLAFWSHELSSADK